MKLSIVTTMYHSAAHLEEFYRRTRAAAEKITKNFEIIFVDDGSPDDSLERALKLHKKDKRVRVVELSRNFGHHKAIITGLQQARGDLVFSIDCDLEEEPELLAEFWKRLQSERELDVVYGVQEKRRGQLFERLSGYLFYRIYNLFSPFKIPANLIIARLMNKKYVQALVSHQEREIFLAGLWALTGFKQAAVGVRKLSHSKTTYNFYRKVSLLINSIASYTNRPLLLIFYLGIFISSGSLAYIFHLIYRKVVYNVSIEGWTSLIVSVWFLGGVIIFCLGILGIYLSKIFTETKQRPYTIIRNIW